MLALEIQTSIGKADSGQFGAELSEVVDSRAAWCVGCAELFRVAGSSIGLSVRGIEVIQTAWAPSFPRKAHDGCAVDLADGKTMLVDVTRIAFPFVATAPFELRNAYRPVGDCWDLNDNLNPMRLPRRMQFLGERSNRAGLHEPRTGPLDQGGPRGRPRIQRQGSFARRRLRRRT